MKKLSFHLQYLQLNRIIHGGDAGMRGWDRTFRNSSKRGQGFKLETKWKKERKKENPTKCALSNPSGDTRRNTVDQERQWSTCKRATGRNSRLLEEETEAGKPRRADKIYRPGHGLLRALINIHRVSQPSTNGPLPLLSSLRGAKVRQVCIQASCTVALFVSALFGIRSVNERLTEEAGIQLAPSCERAGGHFSVKWRGGRGRGRERERERSLFSVEGSLDRVD